MNKKGFTDTTSQSIIIDDIPSLSYTSKSPCFPIAIDVKNTSTIPPFNTIKNIEWKINASYYSTYDLNFIPTISGIQKGYLKITLNTGCFDTIPVSLMSPVTPTITLIPNGDIHICSGDSIKILVNKSIGTTVWNDGKVYDSLLLKAKTFKKAIISVSPQCYTSDSLSLTVEDRTIVNAGADLKTLQDYGTFIWVTWASTMKDRTVLQNAIKVKEDENKIKEEDKNIDRATKNIKAWISLNETDKKVFEKNINQYIREIDKCIGILSE